MDNKRTGGKSGEESQVNAPPPPAPEFGARNMTGSAAVRRLLLAAAAVFMLAGCDQLQMGDTVPSLETTKGPPALLEDGGIVLDGDAGTITLKFSGEVEDFAPLDYIKIEPAGSSSGEKVAVIKKGETVEDNGETVHIYMELVPKGINEKGEYEYEIKLDAVVKFPPSRKVEFAVSPADKPEPQASMRSANVDTVLPVVQFSELGADTIELYAMIEIADAEFLAFINTGSDNSLKEKYKQTADITISGDWTPIGAENSKFMGTFDGGGYTIFPNITSSGRLGIFGYAEGATFENIHIGTGSMTTTGNSAIGGIAVDATNTTFTNCSNAADLTSGEASAGGICLTLRESSLITGCWNSGDIIGYTAGGICSFVSGNSAIIKNCYNSGHIVGGNSDKGGSEAGGIAGSNSGKIFACYNTGAVEVKALSGENQKTGYAGGIVGSLNGEITACYNTGAVKGAQAWQSYVGGIAGQVNGVNGPSMTACYNTGYVSSSATLSEEYTDVSIGGIAGRAHNGGSKAITITACYSTGTVEYTGLSTVPADNSLYQAICVGGVFGVCGSTTEITSTFSDCYWKAVEGLDYGIGGTMAADDDCFADETEPSNEGTTQFGDAAWPANSGEWGTGDGSGSGKYWKSLGAWNGENPVYPKLWFENNL
jgi:hypothetical protein